MLKLRYYLIALAMVPVVLSAQTTPQQQPAPGMQPAQMQNNFSDEDLEKFSRAAAKITEIQQSAESQMMEAIEKQGLDLDTYNQIAQSQQNPQADVSAVAEDDLEKFKAVSGDLQQIQMDMQPKMMEAIEEEGIEIQKYQEIVAAYQQDPALQLKIQEMMEN